MAQVVQPLLDGYRTGTREFTLAEEEKPIAAAVLEHNMLSEAALQWQRRQSSMDCASGHGCGRPNVGTIRTIQKNLLREGPKTISCSSLAEADFEVQRHHGGWKTSEIPRKTSARGGADLREDFHGIWGGQPFSRSPSSSSGSRMISDQITQDEEGKSWTQRSILAMLDGVNSVRWAWILLQLGEEDHVHAFGLVHAEGAGPPQQAREPPGVLGIGRMEGCHGDAL